VGCCLWLVVLLLSVGIELAALRASINEESVSSVCWRSKLRRSDVACGELESESVNVKCKSGTRE
jgi:hypothetical protein